MKVVSEKSKLEEEIKLLQNRLQQLEGVFDGKNSHENQLNLSLTSDYPHQIFIEKMVEGAVIISKLGIILYANRSFTEMIDYSNETVIGKSILDFVLNIRRPHFLEHLEAEKKLEVELLKQNKKTLTVSLSITKVIWKDSEDYYLLASDITDIKRTQMYSEALESITNVLIDLSSPSITFKLVIEILKNYFDWDLIIVWNRNKDLQNLHCVEASHVQGKSFDAFIEKTREMDHSIMAFPENVWTAHRPLWLEDVTEEPTFLRRNEANTCNLRGALAFPYYYGDELGGVIELFRQAPFQDKLDEPLYNFIVSMGIEVGLYSHRKREAAINLYYSNIINMHDCGIYIIDLQGIVKSWNPAAERIYGWRADEIIGSSIKKIYHPEGIDEFNGILKMLSEGKTPDPCQSERMRKDNNLIWVEDSYGVIKYQWGAMEAKSRWIAPHSSEEPMVSRLPPLPAHNSSTFYPKNRKFI